MTCHAYVLTWVCVRPNASLRLGFYTWHSSSHGSSKKNFVVGIFGVWIFGLLQIWLITLGGCCHLDGLEQRGSSSGGWWFSPAPIVVIVRVLDLSRRRAKRYSSELLMAYMILILCWLCCTLLRVWRVIQISAWTFKWVYHHNED